jgi:hypothetical protein
VVRFRTIEWKSIDLKISNDLRENLQSLNPLNAAQIIL